MRTSKSEKRLSPFGAWLLASLLGCGSSALPPPPPPEVITKSPAPSATTPPPAPTAEAPKPLRELETHAFGLGSVSVFTPITPWVRGARSLHFVYLFCNVEETGAKVGASCVPMDRAAFFRKSGLSPDTAFFQWAKAETQSIDDPPNATVARDFAERYRGTREWDDAEADRIVFIQIDRWHLEDETRSGHHCEHTTHPCDEAPIRTGRKVRVRYQDVEVKYRGQPFDVSLAEHGGIGRLVGSEVTYIGLMVTEMSERFVSPGNAGGAFTRLPWSAEIERARSPATASSSLSALTTMDDTDPRVKLALAYNRVMIAARVRDQASFKAAMADLDRALAEDEAAAQRLSPSLLVWREIARGERTLEPPAGLRPYLKESTFY